MRVFSTLISWSNENKSCMRVSMSFLNFHVLVIYHILKEILYTLSFQTCFTSQHFYGMYSRNDGNINKTDLIQLCPAMLYQMTKQECHAKEKMTEEEEEEETGKEKPVRGMC